MAQTTEPLPSPYWQHSLLLLQVPSSVVPVGQRLSGYCPTFGWQTPLKQRLLPQQSHSWAHAPPSGTQQRVLPPGIVEHAA